MAFKPMDWVMSARKGVWKEKRKGHSTFRRQRETEASRGHGRERPVWLEQHEIIMEGKKINHFKKYLFGKVKSMKSVFALLMATKNLMRGVDQAGIASGSCNGEYTLAGAPGAVLFSAS